MTWKQNKRENTSTKLVAPANLVIVYIETLISTKKLYYEFGNMAMTLETWI